MSKFADIKTPPTNNVERSQNVAEFIAHHTIMGDHESHRELASMLLDLIENVVKARNDDL